MATVSVVYWQPTGGLMAQADRLGPRVSSHLELCCIHCINRANSCKCSKHDDSTMNIMSVLLLYYYY